MKEFITGIALVLTAGLIFTAGSHNLNMSDVPATVTNSFAHAFPGSSAEWEKEDAGFEANFEKDGKEMSAVYDANGNQQEVETEIEMKALPSGVGDYLSKNYNGVKIKEAAMIKKASGETNYEVEVRVKI